MEIHEWLPTKLGRDILTQKYLQPGETLDQFFDRVSGGDPKVRKLIVEKRFLPAGRILSNRGVDRKGSLSNCYVITPPEDNIESIWECSMKMARTYSYGGGCGTDLGKIAPAGAAVDNEARQSSGSASFMKLYSVTTELIGQNGRRGALMLSMPVSHPDIEKFIHAKEKNGDLSTANISVRVSDDFMRAVEADADWHTSFTRPETGDTVEHTFRARDLFHQIAENAWDNGEPGVLFWDAVKRRSYLEYDPEFEFAGTNPCGEEPLPAGGSCLLGSMNLAAYVLHPFRPDAVFDFDTFSMDVKTAVEELNRILDEGRDKHPLQEQRESVSKWRQIGLGVMGLGDALAMMNLRYGSDEAIQKCTHIAKILRGSALMESIALGERDGSYPAFKEDAINASRMIPQTVHLSALRNSQILTCAPTGSISNLLGISGGIEPIFSVEGFSRKTESLHGETVVYDDNTSYSVRLWQEMYPGVELPDYFVGAHDIPWEKRLRTQAAWQKYIDAAISSTVNLPNSATVEDVEKLYLRAWKLGLKGVTVFRDGCRRAGVLTEGKAAADQAEENAPKELVRGEIADVPEGLTYHKHKLHTGCGTLYLFVGVDENGNVHDVFTNASGDGGCPINTVAVSRSISIQLRAGIPIEKIAEQMDKAGVCPSYQRARGAKKEVSPGKSCPSSIGRVLLEYARAVKSTAAEPSETAGAKIAPEVQQPLGDQKRCEASRAGGCAAVGGSDALQMRRPLYGGRPCPECGAEMMEQGGCPVCPNCGYSRCG